MLRTCIETASRGAFASTSKLPGCSITAAATLHTSSVNQFAAKRTRPGRALANAKKTERNRAIEQSKPHVVLGTRPGEEAKWQHCDLAKVLLTPEAIDAAAATDPTITAKDDKKLALPQHLSYGVDGGGVEAVREENVQFFFEHLPNASAARDFLNLNPQAYRRMSETNEPELRELQKANQFARVIDLRNANARGIAFENRRRIVAAFSEAENPYDPGRPEVQAAILTMKIRNMWDHLMKFKKDIPNRRALRMVVHQRAKILKYLKRIDRDRYDRILHRLALEPDSVEGELLV